MSGPLSRSPSISRNEEKTITPTTTKSIILSCGSHFVFNGFIPKVNQIIRNTSRETTIPHMNAIQLNMIDWGCNLEVPGSNPLVGPDICHWGWAYIYSASNCSKAWSVECCLWYCALKKTLKSFKLRVGHSHAVGLPSVAILPWLCRKCREAIFTHWFPPIHVYTSFVDL